MSERFFRLELDFAMAELLEYNESGKHHRGIADHGAVVVEVVIKEIGVVAGYI